LHPAGQCAPEIGQFETFGVRHDYYAPDPFGHVYGYSDLSVPIESIAAARRAGT